MKHFKSVLVGCAAAVLAAFLYLLFYSRKLQIVEMGWGGFVSIDHPLIEPSLVVVFIAAFALGFFWMARQNSN